VSTDLERFPSATDGPRRSGAARPGGDRPPRGSPTSITSSPRSTGRIMGKGAPADHWERIGAETAFQLVYGLDGQPVYRPARQLHRLRDPRPPSLVGLPDVETFCQAGRGIPKTARGVLHPVSATGRKRPTPGGFLTSDLPRQPAADSHRVSSGRTGLHMRVGTEPEMMWPSRPSRTATPSVDGMTKPYCYHIDQFSEPPAGHPQGHGVQHRRWGLDMIQG